MSEKILLVEDNAVLSKNVAKYLELEGFEVETSAEGGRALEKALSGKFSLAVLDIHLPGAVSGLEVLRIVREKGITLPILMLTAKSSTHDKVGAFELGADDYLVKPFELAELAARIRARLRAGAAGSAQPGLAPGQASLTIGDLTLDRERKRASDGGRDVALSALEYRLLEYLMERAGRTIPRADLLRDVWGREDDESTRAVDVYVGYLRRKVGPGRIVTVKGFGYLFE